MANTILDHLACALGRADEQPNIDLAIKISKTGNKSQVAELIKCLENKKTAIRSDAIKVLYEIGERKSALIIPYLDKFMEALRHKDNRMRWGAMSALSAISKANPEALGPHMVTIVDSMDEGSVITRDRGVYILCDLAKVKKYHKDCMELLLEQIEHAPVNQMAMYAEKTAEVLSTPYKSRLIQTISRRKYVFAIPTKAKRLEKLLRSLEK
jgi:hypothetical protein